METEEEWRQKNAMAAADIIASEKNEVPRRCLYFAFVMIAIEDTALKQGNERKGDFSFKRKKVEVPSAHKQTSGAPRGKLKGIEEASWTMV